MPVIERAIALNVPVELAFRYLSDPSHLSDFCPNMIEISDMERHLRGSGKFAWVYKMMGVRILGEAEVNETKHNHQLNMRFWGGIHGNIVWQFQPLDEGIRLDVKCEYNTPVPLLKKHSDDTILYQNEHTIEQMLLNLKTLLDIQSAQTPHRL